MNKSLKRSLDDLTIKHLERLYTELVTKEIISVPKQTNDTIGAIPSSETDNEVTAVRTMINHLHDLRTVMQVVHNVLYGSTVNNNLLSYVEFFTDKKVINVNLTDKKLQSLFDGYQDVSEDDFSQEWIGSLRTNKIDLTELTHQVLEYYTLVALNTAIDNKYDFKIEYAPETVGDFILKSNNGNKNVLVEVKFRRSIADLKNMITREVAKLKNLKTEASKYLILMVYTNQQEHLTQKLIGQFKKTLVELDNSLIGSVFFQVITINKIEEVAKYLGEIMESIKGLELLFEFEKPPLQNGWTASDLPELKKLSSVFSFHKDDIVGSYLDLKLPHDRPNVNIRYKLAPKYKWKFNKVSFSVGKFDGGVFIELLAKHEVKSLFFKIEIGLGDPKKYFEEDWDVYNIPISNLTKGRWHYLMIDVQATFEKTFALYGYVFDRIEGIVLSGHVSISKIVFE